MIKYMVWAIMMATICSNNEILDMHRKNGTKPSFHFWISVMFTFIALVLWIANCFDPT